ncbi:MAG TPA: hypothetical protein VJR92_07900 [Gemmatimonadaceae bacterium]|nr:hypothetical protein [Gemmatimonadaceae bacterium]
MTVLETGGAPKLYSVYGSCLGTSVEFPELRAIPSGAARWTFRVTAAHSPMVDRNELGAELIYGDVHARLFRHADGYRVTVDDTGAFEIANDGRDISWENREGAWPDFVRAHLIGRVLATALFFEGWLPLHGSAVAFRSGVAAFLAPKGFGKSTLALALTAAGAKLVTDDTLPVELTQPPCAWPGVHAVRVRPDAAEAIGLPGGGAMTREGKTLVTDLPMAQLSHERAPLSALYFLDPVDPAKVNEPVTRVRLPETLAALSVVSHVKIARMLGASSAPTLLDRAATIVRAIPAYQLSVPRDLAGLRAVAARITEWHSA